MFKNISKAMYQLIVPLAIAGLVAVYMPLMGAFIFMVIIMSNGGK